MSSLIALVVGTRPEAIKMAPIALRLANAHWCQTHVIVSGQHDSMLAQTMASCGLMADTCLPYVGAELPLTSIVARLLEGMRASLDALRPAMILTQGDTATAFAATLAAFYARVPVGHVEAGLRTWNLDHPFPEETHRQAISRMATLHFAPTAAAAANLLNDGVPSDRVFLTGNTIVDQLQVATKDSNGDFRSPSRDGRRIVIVTLHRRELRPLLEDVVAGLTAAAAQFPDLEFIWPMHPSIAGAAKELLGTHHAFTLLSPLPHGQFIHMLKHAKVVVTDSGGVQEEAALLGIPLIIARYVTERPEVLRRNRAVVTGMDMRNILASMEWALGLTAGNESIDDFGNGEAAAKIEQALAMWFSEHEPCPSRKSSPRVAMMQPR